MIDKQKELCIQDTCKETGWDREYAEQKIEDARRRLGVNYRDYRVWKLYEHSYDEDQKNYYKKRLAIRERLKINKRKCIDATMEATGWDQELAVKKIDAAKKAGIGYNTYARMKLYLYPPEEQVQIIRKNRSKSFDNVVAKAMRLTGWDVETTKADLIATKELTNCTNGEYLLYRFYELSEQQKKEVFVQSFSEKIGSRYNDSGTISLFDNKEMTNKVLEEYLKRKWCVNIKVSRDEFKNLFCDCDKIIYKPLRGVGGKGIEAFSLTEDTLEEIYDQIHQLPEGVVEEYFYQHPVISAINPDSVNTIRVATVSSDREPVLKSGEFFDIAFASIRIGGGGAIVDNIHSGGMVANIDLDDGTIKTDAVDLKGNIYVVHPKTKTTIKGTPIPFFEEIKRMVTEVVTKNHLYGYLGWDIAVGEKGPVIIEANTNPGPSLIQTPYAHLHIGMKPLMEKYYW